jgi:putative SOS response-associated peptidase YedK
MCGRFTIMLEADDLREALELGSVPEDWYPRFNLAPSQRAGVVVDPGSRNLGWMKWGLVPSWAKDAEIGNRMINARAETLSEKPSFRQAFARRRCLIPADGFYEWQHPAGSKGRGRPFHIHLNSSQPFFLAGLWERWQPQEGDPLLSFTIITTQANELVASIHERMPVILTGQEAWNWLRPQPVGDLARFLRPYPSSEMAMAPVTFAVNNPANESPACIEPEA